MSRDAAPIDLCRDATPINLCRDAHINESGSTTRTEVRRDASHDASSAHTQCAVTPARRMRGERGLTATGTSGLYEVVKADRASQPWRRLVHRETIAGADPPRAHTHCTPAASCIPQWGVSAARSVASRCNSPFLEEFTEAKTDKILAIFETKLRLRGLERLGKLEKKYRNIPWVFDSRNAC